MKQIEVNPLLRAVEIARPSRQNGTHPFGALLAGPDGEILLEAENSVFDLPEARTVQQGFWNQLPDHYKKE